MKIQERGERLEQERWRHVLQKEHRTSSQRKSDPVCQLGDQGVRKADVKSQELESEEQREGAGQEGGGGKGKTREGFWGTSSVHRLQPRVGTGRKRPMGDGSQG